MEQKKLIDANALMEDFRQYMVERHDRIKCAYEENCKVCDRECLWRRVVKKAPVVDAVEVVHAQWEPHHMVPGFVQCSACRDCITYDDWPDGQKWKYCPNCGAKMDGERMCSNGTE